MYNGGTLMLRETEKLMMESYNIKPHVFELYKKALNDVEEQFKIYDEIRETYISNVSFLLLCM